MKLITDMDLAHKKVLMRLDLNLPLDQGAVRDATRLHAALPTIRYALDQGAAVMLMSHLGRPQEGQVDAAQSLQLILPELSQALGQEVKWLGDDFEQADVSPGQCALFENVRFLSGEKANDDDLGRRMAQCCDVYVMDAFATAHRAQASTYAVAKYAPQVCAGLLVKQELDYLEQALAQPERPLLAIVGGSKVSGKIDVLEHLMTQVDALIVGGGIANTFLAAQGFDVASSLYEADWVAKAAELIQLAQDQGVQFPLPTDVVVADRLESGVAVSLCDVAAVPAGQSIFDVGPQTMQTYAGVVAKMKTIVWNGPLGVFELAEFAAGTRALADVVAASDALSIAGGGDTVAALTEFGLSDKISYISTAGGAFLTFLEGKELPAMRILTEREQS